MLDLLQIIPDEAMAMDGEPAGEELEEVEVEVEEVEDVRPEAPAVMFPIGLNPRTLVCKYNFCLTVFSHCAFKAVPLLCLGLRHNMQMVVRDGRMWPLRMAHQPRLTTRCLDCI